MASQQTIQTRKNKHLKQGQRGLEEALALMEFESEEMRELISESYKINLGLLVGYACVNKISPYRYLYELMEICQTQNSRQR